MIEPVHLVWTASVAGAVLFYLAGVLTAAQGHRRDSKPAVEGDRPEEEQLSTALIQAVVEATTSERERLRAEVDRLAELCAQLAGGPDAVRGRRRVRTVPQFSGPQCSGPQFGEPPAPAPQPSRPQFLGPQFSGPQFSGPESSGSAGSDAGSKTQPYSEYALRRLLDEVSSFEGMRGAVVADSDGAALVTSGEFGDDLATFAALLDASVQRAPNYLPTHHRVRHVTVEDEQGTTLTCCPFAVGDSHLVLGMVTVGSGPRHEQMAEWLQGSLALQ